ncbi:MAG: pyridoxal phosphate-dependent aminotransferase [Phycisphaerae bacterium]
MKYRLSESVQAVAPSATLAATERARQLREQGVNVISLAAGQPDFDTPQHIKDAACAALAAGDTKYPLPVSGVIPLRKAIQAYIKRYCELDYAMDQLCVTVGCKDALHLAFVALLNPGDEAIVPVPYWVSYPDQIRMTGAKPVFVESSPLDGKITPAQLRSAITPRTRVLVMNSPSNPGGAVFSRAELTALAEVLQGTDIIVVSDEIYHRLAFEVDTAASVAAAPGMYERTVTVNGLGKSYAMTGWRIGYAGGPAPIIEAMTRLIGTTTSGATSFVQTAAITALTGPQENVARMREAFVRRARRMCDALRAIPGLKLPEPKGAFFCFPDVSALYARLGVRDADEFAHQALDRAHVAIVSGSAFGSQSHVRLSYATADDQIEEAMRRLTKWLA